MEYVQPKKIVSPISGQLVHPKLVTIRGRDKIVTEAHWIDPVSGMFIRKGVVKVDYIKQD